MAHNLFLGMYTFSIKKKNLRIVTRLDNNDFLEQAYLSISENKFAKGFCQDIISLTELKAYKNSQNTHGARLDKYSINQESRTLDIMIDGGLTGIKQFLINEDGEKSELSEDDIVGLKFFARFWLPSNTQTGYVFIQRYGGMSIKPIFDSILKDLLNKYDFSIVHTTIKASTTKKRLKLFLEKAALKNIIIVSNTSLNSTGAANASSVEVRLKNFNTVKKTSQKFKIENIREALSNHGFTIGDKRYEIKGTYEYSQNGVTEERTAKLDASEETINIVPNVIVPLNCIDSDNYPIFDEMVKLVNEEMEQVKIEAKL